MQNDKRVAPLDPWDPERDRITIREVASLLRRQYGLAVSVGTIMKWIKEGAIPQGGCEKDRIYLKAAAVTGTSKRLVRKADLEAFLNYRIEKSDGD